MDDQSPAARSENTMMRFLRWLIEPPAGPQPRGLLVLRWLLRAGAVVVYAMCVGTVDGTGNAGVGPKGKKPAK